MQILTDLWSSSIVLSWRLWQTIAEPVTHNPIFKRVSDDYLIRAKPGIRRNIPWYVYVLLSLVLIIIFIRAPYFALIILQIPALLIALIVLSPAAMPLFAVVAGSYLVWKIISVIDQEKRQFTYELLCAIPDGCLDSSWLVAVGILHRGSWFMWLKTCVQWTYRIAQIALIILGVLIALSLPSMENDANRFESLQSLVKLLFVLALYYTSMTQPLVFSLVIGIYATSLNLGHRDSSLVGLFGYLLFQIAPYVIAFALFVTFSSIPDVPALLLIGFDIIIFGSIYLIRELSLYLMWSQLKRQLNSSSDYTILPSRVASVTS